MVKIKKKLELVFLKQIIIDVFMIDSALTRESKLKDLYLLHCEIDGKYQSLIENWGRGMYQWNDSFGFDYNGMDSSRETLEHNLNMMKAKLDSFKYTFNVDDGAKNSQRKITNIYNTQYNNLYFEQVTQYIQNNYTLSDKDEILSKIDEIKQILKSSETKEEKWNRLSKIGKWVFDKSVDVGIQLLPMFLGLK